MEYLTQKELQKIILLSYERIEQHKEEINKINIFPVPDQDTGSNMAKTLLGIKTAIEGKEFKDLDELSKAALDGALSAAQGNAGVIYTGFLAGFFPLLNKNPVDAKKLAAAFEKGAERARKSIQKPKEGTILDVIDAASQAFKEESEKEKDLIKVLKIVVGKANEALLATREKMEIFRKANVVDAGGLGFLMILESYLETLEGEKKEEKREEKPSEKVRRFVQILSNRYEIVALIQNPQLDEDVLREKLKKLGNSIDIVQIKDKMKVHIHTDYPDEVRNVIRQAGSVLELRIEDMTKEVVGEPSVRKVSIGIVTDDITSLLPKILERYQIEIAKTSFDWPEMEKMPGVNLYQKMRNAEKFGVKTFAKTSQATPKSYLDAFKKQLQRFDKVLCITVSSELSGCFNSAIQAREMLSEEKREKVFVLDSLTGAAGQALLVLRAIELIQEQREIGEVLVKLKNLLLRIHTYLIFEDPKWIEALGRITKSQANWVRRMKKIRLRPLMEIKKGLIGRGGVILAKDMAETLFKKIFKESKKEAKKIRVVINHADNLEQAEKLKKMLKGKMKVEIPFISLAPPTIAAAAGPGTLIAAWMARE